MSHEDDNTPAVRVIVRERPARDSEGLNEGPTSVISYHECSVNTLIADGRVFTFDNLLGPTATQEELFLQVRPLVGKVKNGYNCTALAYGQTGTGKSYSMGLSSNSSEGVHVGIIPRCLMEILKANVNEDLNGTDNILSSEFPFEVHASFIEIYNEKAFDLLGENTAEPIISRGYKYTGGTRKALKTIDDCYSVLQQGNKNRHVRPTKMNSQSSRSHAIFTIHVRSASEKGNLNTRLNLVDLAGSEGVRRTGHQGVAMSEGVNINQGLLSIGKVLQAKALGHKMIPYRDSVLTSVLQDSLNENSFLTLLACISPHRADLTETLSTLRFAQSVKQLKHSPHINLTVAESKKPRMKTPKRSVLTPAPKKRPYTKIGMSMVPVALKHAYHSNTFCTPSKLKRNTIADKLNHSEIGLTPKQKEKALTGMLAPLVPGLSSMHTNLTSKNQESSILMDRSLDSRASIMSLNVSSSTMFGNDGPSTSKTTSYSPVVRKCMAEIGNFMDNKMSQFLETLSENFRPQTIIVEKTPCSTPWATDPSSVRPLPTALRQELRSIVKEVLKENVGQTNGNDTESIIESSLIRNDPKCQLFSTSSPVFKVPAVPNGETESTEKSIEDHGQSEGFEVFEERPQNNAAVRRSRRISHRLHHSLISDVGACRTLNETLRRSRRISTMREKIEEQAVHGLSEAIKFTGNTHLKNKSLKQLHIERRESIRNAAHLNGLELDEGNERIQNNLKKLKSSQKRYISDLNNSIIESYFTNDPKKSTPNVKAKKANIKKHRKAVLDLLNSGSMKELQILPQIGQKTAFQLVTQRTLSGKFKNISQLEKLPIWRGNSWTRFAKANLLLD